MKQNRDERRKGQRVQIEVRSAQELEEALQFGAEAILLDNMTPAEVKRSVGAEVDEYGAMVNQDALEEWAEFTHS